MIRILIADDDAMVRHAIRTMLEAHSDLHVVGEARDGRDAVALVPRLHPHVVLMDIRMPHLDGLAATRRITATPDGPRVVVLTTFGTSDCIDEALRSGADGFLVKDTPPFELAQSVRDVADGLGVLSPFSRTRL